MTASIMLTSEQAESLRASGMFVVREDGCPECIDGCDIADCRHCGEEYTEPCQRHRAAGHVPSDDPYGDLVDCRSCCVKCGGRATAPAEWTAHAGPCATCGGKGEIVIGYLNFTKCPDCIDGSKVVELRETCQQFGRAPGVEYHDGQCCKDGTILVARASITVLPAVAHGTSDWPYQDVMSVGLTYSRQLNRVWLWNGVSAWGFGGDYELDPLPVAGRDFLFVVNSLIPR